MTILAKGSKKFSTRHSTAQFWWSRGRTFRVSGFFFRLSSHVKKANVPCRRIWALYTIYLKTYWPAVQRIGFQSRGQSSWCCHSNVKNEGARSVQPHPSNHAMWSVLDSGMKEIIVTFMSVQRMVLGRILILICHSPRERETFSMVVFASIATEVFFKISTIQICLISGLFLSNKG